MSDARWEAICRQCGDCCFEKVIGADGEIHQTSLPCRYLDITTRRCKVYHKRFETGEECIRLTPDLVREVDWLADTCAYVRHLRQQDRNRD